MMQHITKQYCVNTIILEWKVATVVRNVLDAGGGGLQNVDTSYSAIQQRLEVMSNETVATTYIQHIRERRNQGRDFESHVVSAPNLPSSSHASIPAPNY